MIDEIVSRQAHLKHAIASELLAAQEEFHNSIEQSPLANNILARFETAKVLFDEPIVPYGAIETLAIEREHFRVREGDNKRAAAAMRRLRSSRRSAQ